MPPPGTEPGGAAGGYFPDVQIFVSLPSGSDPDHISLEAEVDASLSFVRASIADRYNVLGPYDLYYNSQKLADDKTLADYNIPKESTLTFVYQTTGESGTIANTGVRITHTGVPMGATSLLVGAVLLLAARLLRRRPA